MLTVAFRWRKKIAAAAAAVIAAVLLFLLWAGQGSAELPQRQSAPQDLRWVGSTEQERQAFFSALGWTVSAEPVEIVTVQIPEKFDVLYNQYNTLQKSQGCDLTDLAGQLCRQYRYAVERRPGSDGEAWAVLLVHEGKIVGGDLSVRTEEGMVQRALIPAEEGGIGEENVLS